MATASGTGEGCGINPMVAYSQRRDGYQRRYWTAHCARRESPDFPGFFVLDFRCMAASSRQDLQNRLSGYHRGSKGAPTDVFRNRLFMTALTTVMCWKCRELDEYIAHYRELKGRVTDPLTRESIDILVEKAEAQKEELHPEN
jgi:hypothetical protein